MLTHQDLGNIPGCKHNVVQIYNKLIPVITQEMHT